MIKSNQPLGFEHTCFTKGTYYLVKCRIRWGKKIKNAYASGCVGSVGHYREMIDIYDPAIKAACVTLGIDFDDLIIQSTAAYNS